MRLIYIYLFPVMWLGFVLYWWAMATKVKAAARMEPAASRRIRALLLFVAIVLLWLPRVPLPLVNRRFLPLALGVFWAGAAVTAAGLFFAIWARHHLGRNWSQAVTVKEDHELIQSGPYALVRHPIYTGLLAAFLGSAIARAEWRGLIALLLVFVPLWQKLKLEEKWMREHFGLAYELYSRRVRALVPFLI